MESLTELVEASVDWLAEIPAGRTQVIAQFVVDEPDPIDLLTRLVGNTADIQIVNGPIGKWPPKRRPHEQEELRDAFLNEVHDFFCSDTKYSKERQSILREYHAGESSFVAGVTAAISPHVGGQSPEAKERQWRLWRENVRRFVAGEKLLCVVDKAKGY